MKKLFLVRHAKSSWDEPGLSDLERPLNKRGKKDAPFMADLVKNSGQHFDQIISSPALRAITTAMIFAEALGFNKKDIIKKESLYEADFEDILNNIRELDNSAESAILFGHNPGLTIFNNYMTDKQIENLPTCGILEIEFDLESWRDIEEYSGKLISFDYPKNHLH
ncbi:MAG: histidine phosphatase family protein [bacterium]